MPRPIFVTHTLRFHGLTLQPPTNIGRHVTASVAWRDAGLIKERLARYQVYLARVSARFPSKNGVPMLERTPAWVITLHRGAGPDDDPAPFVPGRTPPPIRSCVFYDWGFGVVIAKSGKNFESASG
ncbi:MAG TPA: hypothetical protein VHV76_13080 [Mycobacteriales bacterium]|nr:hypothetical protein [Mycobacteriales bacterium]